MKILIAGGRWFGYDKNCLSEADQQRVKEDIEYFEYCMAKIQEKVEITHIIQGGATGADMLAKTWANNHNMPQTEYKADWHIHGKAAGPIRNQQMLEESKPDLVVVFPGGPGSTNMFRQATKAKIKIIDLR